jgi:hypothetical protein
MKTLARLPLKTKPGILGHNKFLLQAGVTRVMPSTQCSDHFAEGQADEPECREPTCCWGVQQVSLPMHADRFLLFFHENNMQW